MTRLLVTASLLVFVLGGCVPPVEELPAAAPRVTAEGEDLEGLPLAGGGAAFLGMPYAAPPVGDLRWRPPQPITPRQGLQAATAFAKACVQGDGNLSFRRHIAHTFGRDEGTVVDHFADGKSEDCLYLNVWTPAWPTAEPLPVLFWIHGGANVNGAGHEPVYDGEALAREGAVVVTVNYRLNAFGFFAHEALTAEDVELGDFGSGNQGILDLVAALEWARRNVAAFGGDPDNVTIFGESAGAANVAYLMASPLARGLFHKAISQSGGYPLTDLTTLAQAEDKGAAIAKKLGVTDAEDVLAALRARTAEEVLEAGAGVVAPNADGHVLPDLTGRIFQRGEQADVPLVIGWNADEWTALRHYWPIAGRMAYHGAIAFAFGEDTPAALRIYGVDTEGEVAPAYDTLMADAVFVCPSRFLAHSMTGPAKTWVYVFTRVLPGEGGAALGAYHAADLSYVFGNLTLDSWMPYEPDDEDLSTAMRKAWVRFARTGDPNGGGLPAWPAFNDATESYFEFGDVLRSGERYRSEVCELHDKALARKLAGQ